MLVTGGAGFIGSTLVDRLLAEDHEVSVVDDLSTGRLEHLAGARRTGRVSFTRFDLATAGLDALLARDRPEVVCHLAAATEPGPQDPVADARTDVGGTVNLLEACVAAGVRKIVLASSWRVLGRPPVRYAGQPVSERVAPAPVDPRAAGTLAAENYVTVYGRRAGLAHTTLVLAGVYGPREPAHRSTSSYAAQLMAGRRVALRDGGRVVRDRVHVDDVVDAFVRALGDDADGRRLHVGSGVGTTARELHRVVAGAVGVPDAPAFAAADADQLPGVVLDVAAARRALGWEPFTPLATGVGALVDRLREERSQAG